MQLGQLKLNTIEKSRTLRETLKESEKRQREMDDYQSNVRKLQQWMADTKQLTLSHESGLTTISLPDHKLQQVRFFL